MEPGRMLAHVRVCICVCVRLCVCVRVCVHVCARAPSLFCTRLALCRSGPLFVSCTHPQVLTQGGRRAGANFLTSCLPPPSKFPLRRAGVVQTLLSANGAHVHARLKMSIRDMGDSFSHIVKVQPRLMITQALSSQAHMPRA